MFVVMCGSFGLINGVRGLRLGSSVLGFGLFWLRSGVDESGR